MENFNTIDQAIMLVATVAFFSVLTYKLTRKVADNLAAARAVKAQTKALKERQEQFWF